MKDDIVIESKNLSKDFVKGNIFQKNNELNIINNISFTIYRGERVGIIGLNGAGKSTLIKILSGLMIQSSGKIEVLGYIPWKRKYEFLRQISVLFGNISFLNQNWSVRKNFELGRIIYDLSEKTFREHLISLSKELNLESLLDTKVNILSLGQRMRCEILYSLLHLPKILLLDEPSIGIDFQASSITRDIIIKFCQQNNTTLILTSHNIKDIEKICNRVLIIDKGTIINDISLETLHKKYESYKYIRIAQTETINNWNYPGTKINQNEIEINLNQAKLEDILTYILNHTEFQIKDIYRLSLSQIINNILGND